MKHFIVAVIAIFIITNISAQTNADFAMDKMMEGIKLVDENKLEEAITAFTKGQKLDPKNIDIAYEIAHCYYAKGDYKSSIPILEKICKNPKALDHVYQLLGNSYDNEFRRSEALTTYKKGLEKYPNSGPLYSEIGVMYIAKKDLPKALNYFEKGIQVDPTFVANYYHACKLYCASKDAIWGLLYGEMYMNMDRNSGRTQEISKILFDTYKKGFMLENNKIIKANFCNDSIYNNKTTNYSQQILVPTLLSACTAINDMSIQSLSQIRENFIKLYMQKYNSTHPNILFAYLHKIHDTKLLEAYNYWLLNKGDEVAFKTWASNNKNSFNDFLKWYKDNPIVIDESHKMHRLDY